MFKNGRANANANLHTFIDNPIGTVERSFAVYKYGIYSTLSSTSALTTWGGAFAMDKEIKVHIILDVIVLLLQLVLWGWFCLFLIPLPLVPFCFALIIVLSVAFSLRIFRWCRIAFDVRFKDAEIVYTKSYRFAAREKINDFSKLRYSKIYFDDDNLKKDFIYFGNEVFKNGDLLEIVYYPKSRYIESIKTKD